MTVFRARPWFLPTSLAGFLTEAGPDGPADAPSDPAPEDRSDAPSGTRPGSRSDTRSADPRPAASRPSGDASTNGGESSSDPADRP
ncbi:hypothetical protein Stsp01_17570 [Streptomyces sp. NBRC 13847]|nr:hypothetical protein Stsp01_17570 [Streptomyces sp. NBRC 13847]